MPDRNPWRASVTAHWPTNGIRVVVRGPGYVLGWATRRSIAVDEASGAEPTLPDDTVPYLQLSTDEARALYEALAEHFGHAGHDMRALRRDYEAERCRVDRLLDVLVRPPVVVEGRQFTTRAADVSGR